MSSLAALQQLQVILNEKATTPVEGVYQVPRYWLCGQEPGLPESATAVSVHPYQSWLAAVTTILEQPPQPLVTGSGLGGDWSRYAVVYSLFVRAATAFDHDGDGHLGRLNSRGRPPAKPTLNRQGYNEVGTFMKALLLLPYVRNLGCNTVHLLPVTAVGRDGRKGNLGSPYAVRHPYHLDETLAEPSLGLGAEVEFAAFVAAAHHLGLRVVLEFVLRTAAKDSDLVAEHPDWFYWIDAAIPDRRAGSADEQRYGMPLFSQAEQQAIALAIEEGRHDELPPPHDVHRQMFLSPPSPSAVYREKGAWRARYPDGRTGRIPGAFSDWPFDTLQPPWGDVTYLRLYGHPAFNYIAYNTLRVYDSRLARPENALRPLWHHLIDIIPYYQERFDIDGALIDMGHALPAPLKKDVMSAARARRPDFALWGEDFDAQEDGTITDYNAVMGSLSMLLPEPEEVAGYLEAGKLHQQPAYDLGAPESHNTLRAAARPGGVHYTRYAAALAVFLPVIPFVHCGVEFGETRPVNTGIGFAPEQLLAFPSRHLALFSGVAFNWTEADGALVAYWQRLLALRQTHKALFTDLAAATFSFQVTGNPAVWILQRQTNGVDQKHCLLLNHDTEQPQTALISLTPGGEQIDQLSGRRLPGSPAGPLQIQMAPGQALWLVDAEKARSG
jgi:starch synthase (maltosyl-transferring)